MRLVNVLVAAKLACAAVVSSSSRAIFLNSTNRTPLPPLVVNSTSTVPLSSSTVNATFTTSASISTLPPLFGIDNDTEYQSCTVWPIEYKTGYWSSMSFIPVTVGTVYTIIDDSNNTTTTSTQQLDQVVVSTCNPECGTWTIDKFEWSFNGTMNVGRTPKTESTHMRLLDGSLTTITYPNGVFQVTDSFYWRGTVTYDQDGTTQTASNNGPSSAPGYKQWTNRDDTAWLPPSPLPEHDAWPNMTIEVDPNDSYGHDYVFIRNHVCDPDVDYILQYFHDPAFSAEWKSCKPPYVVCTQGMSWVEPVNFLLDSTTIHKKRGTTSSVKVFVENHDPTDDRTVETNPRETKTSTRAQVGETRNPTTSTPEPGSTVPHTTPGETKKTEKTPRITATPKETDSLKDHDSTRTKDQPKQTKTRTRNDPNDDNDSTKDREDDSTKDHDNESTKNRENESTRNSENDATKNRESRSTKNRDNDSTKNLENDPTHTTLRPEDSHSSRPLIRVGTETITQNSDSVFIFSGKTLTPGDTITIGSGPSATTVAISTSGSATFLIIDHETSKIRASPRPTSSADFIISTKTFEPGSSVVVSGITYSMAPDGSTVFINGEPHTITLDSQTWVTTLSDGTLLTKTVAPEIEVEAITTCASALTTSATRKSRGKVITEVTSTPQLVFGTQTLSAGSSVVISGMTYSLGKSGSVLYIDGKPTTLNLEDQRTLVTLPNGVIATETEATVTLLLPPSSSVCSTIPSVTQASNAGACTGITWQYILLPAVLMSICIL